MKKNCLKFEPALTAYQAGDLDSHAAARMKKHLDSCPDCRAELDEIRAGYDLIQNALAADAAEPYKLSADRHTRILNAARARAAYVPTFADRVGRLLDFGFGGTTTRYAILRTLVPVAVTLFMILGFASMIMPSLSMRERAYSRSQGTAASVECVTMEAPEMLMDLSSAPSDGSIRSDGLDRSDSSVQLDELKSVDLSAPVPELTKSPLIIKNLYGSRSRAGREGAAGGKATEEADSEYRDKDVTGLPADDLVISLDAADAPAAPSPVAAPKPGPPAKASDTTYFRKSEEIPAPMLGGEVAMGFGSGKPAEAKEKQVRGDDNSKLGAIDNGVVADRLEGGATRGIAASSAPARPADDSRLRKETEALKSVAKKETAQAAAEPLAAVEPEPVAESTFVAAGFNPYVETAKQPFSTFAIDVDTAAYTLTRKFLLEGKLPPPEAVRTEEIINFFEYHYSAPAGDAMFATHSLSAPSPFRPGQQLLRIGVKARRLGREENRRAVLTFAVDTSGSMSSPERLGLIRQALRLLVEKLSPDDLVALIQFDTHARLVLDYTRAANKEAIFKAIDGLQTSGSTNLEEGMRLAYESARRAFKPGAGNRVLLLSDGAANLGQSSADEILAVVADSRRQGIFCSVYGVGRGGFNDVMLETLANKGDGSYVYLDTLDEARRVFVDELASTLNTVAADVKIQVEFDAGRVSQYRQLGYENRRLRKEQFRDNTVDAGEVGSGQSVTALYDLTLAPGGKGPLGVVRIRYRDLRTGRYEEIEAPLPETILTPRFEATDPSFQLAACAAEFAEHLRGSPYTAGSDLNDVAARLRPVAVQYAIDVRVQELLRLVTSAASLKRGTE